VPENEPEDFVLTADNIELVGPFPQDPLHPERSILPPVAPPEKLPVPGVPTAAETKPADSERTRFRGRSKYRAWA
jgi:hypothetical protein